MSIAPNSLQNSNFSFEPMAIISPDTSSPKISATTPSGAG